MKTLRGKLDRIFASSTLLALLVAGLALLAFTQDRELRSLRQSLVTQADMVALASAPALSFNDQREAVQSLAALRADPRVVAAALYDEKGRMFASYLPVTEEALPVDSPTKDAIELDTERVTLTRAVMANQDRVGTLYLQVRHGLARAIAEFLLALALIMGATLTVTLMLSRRLHRQVMAPLRAMTEVAREIVDGRRRRLPQATSERDEEVGAVTSAFNAMLDELELRAQNLEAANDKLRASDARYQLAVRGSSAGLWDWDLRSNQVFYAPRFQSLLGYGENDMPATTNLVQEILHQEDRDRVLHGLHEHLRHGLPFQHECRLRCRNGSYRWFLVTGMAERDLDGSAFRMAGSIVDVTERKEAEQVLQDANRAKDEFLATLAHELRNPLAPIRSGLEILRKDRANGPASQRARDTMQRQLVHMIRLIDDLLDISRINNGKIHLDMGRVHLLRVLESAIEIGRPAIDAARHRLILDLPTRDIEVKGDATRLAQAVGNLLNNAAKYTPEGGTIELRMRQEGMEAMIQVIDNGVGIPSAMLDTVFSLFTQVDRRMERAQGGLGIGLYLVRSLVEMHGGSVHASSAGENRGSTFTIRLPCEQPLAPAMPAEGGASTGTPAVGRKVLVVDDNVDAAETLVAVLDMLGHQARAVHDGETALTVAPDFEPHLVLLDIGLPGLDGYEVARRLRADTRLRGSLLVALTGWGSESDRRRAHEAGFDHHLTKPVEVAELEPLLAGSPLP